MLLVSASTIHVSAKKDDLDKDEYAYSIRVEDPEWDRIDSIEEKKERLRLESSTLLAMTDDDLVQAVLDYPFIYDMAAYETMEKGLVVLKKECDAYNVLVSKEDARDMIFHKMEKILDSKDVLDIEEVRRAEFILPEIILNEKTFSDSFTIDEINKINDFCGVERMSLTRSEKFPVVRAAYVTTPNGSRVKISLPIETHTSAQHLAMDDGMAHGYNVTLLSVGDCRYNCHSYAWYNDSTSNTYWIDDPSPYMNDGSYKKVSTPSDDLRIYYNGTHSGIMTNSTKVRSKWGNMGTFSHSVYSVPSEYNTSNISYWKRN